MPALTLDHAPVAQIDPETLYDILWLRSRIFLEEQTVTEPDLDGRDIEPGSFLVWARECGEIAATARVLVEGDVWVIGRVATDARFRGQGIAARLMRYTLEAIGSRPAELHAQAHLEQWYEQFGFVRSGENYIEAGIEHVMMRRNTGE